MEPIITTYFGVDITTLPPIDLYASYQQMSTKGEEVIQLQEPKETLRRIPNTAENSALPVLRKLITTIPPPRTLQMGKREKTYDEIVAEIRMKGIDIPDTIDEYISKLDPNKTKSKGGYTAKELGIQCEVFGIKKSGNKPALSNLLIQQVRKLSAIS